MDKPEGKNVQLENLMNLCKTCIRAQKHGKGKDYKNALIDQCENYMRLISRTGVVMEQQHDLAMDIFEAHRPRIIESAKTDEKAYWVKDAKVSIEMWWGKGTKWEKNKYCLKIGAAYVSAWNIRQEMDKRINEMENPNEQEMERGKYEYSFTELLNYYLYLVIADALGKLHTDYGRVLALSEIFRNRTYLADKEDDGEGSGEGGLGETISKATGGKVAGTSITKAIDNLASNEGVINGIVNIFDKAAKSREVGGENKTVASMLVELAPDIEATLGGLSDLMPKQ